MKTEYTDTDRINWLESQEGLIDGGDSGKQWQSWEVTRDFYGIPDMPVREVMDDLMRAERFKTL